jgi:hypothetical protein
MRKAATPRKTIHHAGQGLQLTELLLQDPMGNLAVPADCSDPAVRKEYSIDGCERRGLGSTRLQAEAQVIERTFELEGGAEGRPIHPKYRVALWIVGQGSGTNGENELRRQRDADYLQVS